MPARILVVDDLLPNVKLLSVKLTREYFDVITAFNGPEALEKAKAEYPDIILLDIMMPGMDGFEVCARIKSDPETAHIPIVMVTALSDTSDRVRGLEAGADDFLTKPVDDIALFSRVRSLVRLKMTIDQWRLRETASSQLGGIPLRTPLVEEPYTNSSIVLVSDAPLEIKKFETALERDFHNITTVEDNEDLMDILEKNQTDLVIISLTLKDQDGLRICSQLRSNESTRQMPILLIAEEFDMTRTAKGLELGANDYILRPIDKNELLARVRSQVRRKRFQDRLVLNYKANLSMAMTDGLTGLHNRRFLMTHLKEVVERTQESQKSYCVLMLDIDRFKEVNDTYGHKVGDQVLQEFARRVKLKMRNLDMVARYGGEEFVLVLSDTSLAEAKLIAERIRKSISDTPFDIDAIPEGRLNIATSIGLSVSLLDKNNPLETGEDVIERADEALYKAKNAGRNQVALDDGSKIIEDGSNLRDGQKTLGTLGRTRLKTRHFQASNPIKQSGHEKSASSLGGGGGG